MAEPKCLYHLYQSIGYFPKFRVRHVDTLEDYCILKVKSYTPGTNAAEWFHALRLDHMGSPCELRGDVAFFTLLSTREEAKILQRYQDSYVKWMFYESYKELDPPWRDYDI